MPWKAHFWLAKTMEPGGCHTHVWAGYWRERLFPVSGNPTAQMAPEAPRRALELFWGRKSASTLRGSFCRRSFDRTDKGAGENAQYRIVFQKGLDCVGRRRGGGPRVRYGHPRPALAESTSPGMPTRVSA